MRAQISVYNHGQFVGSFYEHRDYLLTKQDIVKAINKEYGEGNWNKCYLDSEETEYNAQLIISVTDMLDALIHIEDYVTRSLTLSGHSEKDIDFILRKVRPVIQKSIK